MKKYTYKYDRAGTQIKDLMYVLNYDLMKLGKDNWSINIKCVPRIVGSFKYIMGFKYGTKKTSVIENFPISDSSNKAS